MKHLHPWLPRVLFAGSALLLVAGLQLFALPDRTATGFAWTIRSALAAATLGSLYLSLAFLAYQGGRAPSWPQSRGTLSALLVLTGFTLAASLLHLDKLHLNGPGRAQAQLWLAASVLSCASFAALGIRQLQARVEEPPRGVSLPAWFRVGLAVQAFAALWDGSALFFLTQRMTALWPLPLLTPLTAQCLAAGYLAAGTLGIFAVWENDWARIKNSLFTYLLLGLLGLFAILRYPFEIRWSIPGSQAYVIFLSSYLAAGIFGWSEARRMGLKIKNATAEPAGTAPLISK
jgi:hypothetical protein